MQFIQLIRNEQDFGTTYSGVAWVLAAAPSEVRVVNEWPVSKGITYEKCPNLLKYEPDGSLRWGFELDRNTGGRIEAIKLLLDPNQPKPIYVPAVDITAELSRLGKAPTAVAADYISAIYKHATTFIESKYPKNYFHMLNKQYVMTVPAVWSEEAQDATLRVGSPSLSEAESLNGHNSLEANNLCSTIGGPQCRPCSRPIDQRARSRCALHIATYGRQRLGGRRRICHLRRRWRHRRFDILRDREPEAIQT